MALNIPWQDIKQRHEVLVAELARPDIDSNKRRELQKEGSWLAGLLQSYEIMESLNQQIAEIDEQVATTTDAEMLELFKEEMSDLHAKIEAEETALADNLFPPDPFDDRSVYLEIRAGAGGKEAALFVADLLRMYTNYAERQGWRVSLEESSTTELGGFKEVVLFIKGKGVYGHLKKESGVHRVQRVPATETAGRVHTSTATVAVLPEAEDVDVTINPDDLRIDVYRSSGSGGQHVNTTDSAVRITHIPSGVVVACQDERSQHKNKAKAMKILQSRILVAQQEQQARERSAQRKEQVGTGMRAEKVRTYNYPQNRITDHQVDLTVKNLDAVMDGKLDEIVEALRQREREDRRKVDLFS